MVRLPLPSAERMKFRALADLGQSALGPMRLVRVESGRYNGKLFALQRLDPAISGDEKLITAILDDAFITAVVFSRNVVQFIAWGHDEEGTYIAVELVQGASLRHLLKAAAARNEKIPDRIIGIIASELCIGLHALHSVRGPDGDLMGLAHGRLGPTNVLLSFKGEVKIADVGLASAKERVAQAKVGGAGIEPAYLAPEQAGGMPPNAKSDLFSFGAVLFELLAGRPPWIAASPDELERNIATEPPPDLAAYRKWCDPFFIELVGACLEKDPEKRIASAGKAAEFIAEWHAARGFGEGSQEALGKLVQRLGSHQLEWFRRAVAGELARPDATALLTTLDRVDFGVDPETRRAGGTIAPPPPVSDEKSAAARAVSVVPAPAPATVPEVRTSMRPPPPPSSPKPARPSISAGRPAEAPEPPRPPPPPPRPSVPPLPPSVKPASAMPEGRPSSPAAESWFPSMWPPASRGGEEARGSVPPSAMTPSARFAFVSRWAASGQDGAKDEASPHRPEGSSDSAMPAKPGAWVAPPPPAEKGPLPGHALAPPRLPSIPSPGRDADAEPEAPPPSSRPEPMPATLRTGSHAIVREPPFSGPSPEARSQAPKSPARST